MCLPLLEEVEPSRVARPPAAAPQRIGSDAAAFQRAGRQFPDGVGSMNAA